MVSLLVLVTVVALAGILVPLFMPASYAKDVI